MVFAQAVIESLDAGLLSTLNGSPDLDDLPPLNTDRYLAMSALQKAIRRGKETAALRAARALMNASPAGFWRRLVVIAFEDIGIANPDLVGQVALAVRERALRQRLGGDWAVGAALVRSLCRSSKDRAVDDLLVCIALDPDLQDFRDYLAEASFPARLACAINREEPAEKQGLAAWFATGARDATAGSGDRVRGCPSTTFDAMRDAGLPGTATEVARLGWKKAGEGMPPLLPVLAARTSDRTPIIADDLLLSDFDIGGVPAAAIDKHSRTGLAALDRYLRASPRMARLIDAHRLPDTSRTKQVGLFLFRAEGVQEVNRLQWEEARRLREKADRIGGGLPPEVAPDAIALLREEIDLLNECRAELVANRSR